MNTRETGSVHEPRLASWSRNFHLITVLIIYTPVVIFPLIVNPISLVIFPLIVNPLSLVMG